MNAVTHPLPVAATTHDRGMTHSRLLRAYLVDTKFEFIRLLRNPSILIPVLAITPIMYYLFGVLFINSFDENSLGGYTRMSILKLMFVNFSVFSILGPSMVSLGTMMAMERDSGLLTFKRALPIPPWGPLAAKTLFTLLTIVLLAIVMTFEAIVFAKLSFSLIDYVQIWSVCIVGAVPFCAIGLYMGARLSGAAANGLVTAVYMTMAMIGGLLFPVPAGFAWITLFSPPFYLSQLAFGVAEMNTFFDPYFPLALLGGITALFGWLAARRLMRPA
jgi:ABC-2 type transport system permease protein